MPRQARQLSETGLYHVMVRGVGRCCIFEDSNDRIRFLEILSGLVPASSVELHAWCLMENHVHFLLRAELSNLSSMMHRLETTYAGYFNRKYDRAGVLFQNRFKSKAVSSESQYLATLRYIHRNPLEAGLSDTCLYMWSSYSEYLRQPFIVNVDFAFSILGNKEAFCALHGKCDDNILRECEKVSDFERERCEAKEADGLLREKLSDLLHAMGAEHLNDLGKARRDAVIRRLREEGATIRQLERLTGLGRGVISRVR